MYPPATPCHTRGFTLIEMSAVLVIIALLVGGILTAQSLIKSTELKNIVADAAKYRAAYNQFKGQYGGPPGDIADATDYWGGQSTTFTCAGGASVANGTCNGDGDGTIDITADYLETFHAWQQMKLAGFIDGNYSGVPGSDTAAPSASTKYGSAAVKIESTPGTNVPLGKRTNSGYALFYLGIIKDGTGITRNTTGYTDFYYDSTNGTDYGTVLLYGSKVTTDLPKGAIFTPEEAYSMDAKADDGVASTGKIFTLATTSASCVTSQTLDSTTATYAVSNASIACNLGMKVDP